MNESETPRTDAAAKDDGGSGLVIYKFARHLETELAASRAREDKLAKALGSLKCHERMAVAMELMVRKSDRENDQTSALFAVLGDNAPARDLTASKTADCIKRDGSQITGFVVTDQWGGIGIIDKSAVRWLTKKEMWWLMHDSAQIGRNLDTANDKLCNSPGSGASTKP